MMNNQTRTILIIGAGFSGAVTAAQLVRKAKGIRLRIILLNRSGRMARGLAYGTQSPDHILNVPAGNMSALDGEPDHFLNFARGINPAFAPGSFVSRGIYGDYLESLLEEAETASTTGVSLERVTGEVASIDTAHCAGACRVTLMDGQIYDVDRVVLAFGHFPSSQPHIADSSFYNCERYLRDPWNGPAIETISPSARVLLLGSGLTAVDVATTLLNANDKCTITLISRRGLLPKSHRSGPVPSVVPPLPAAFDETPGNVRRQLRAFRSHIRSLENGGEDWREALNALRVRTPELWQSLPFQERRRFLRHVQPYWDNHRHRAAPSAHERFARAIDTGAVTNHAGRLLALEETNEGVTVQFTPRGALEPRCIEVDYVINCIGPSSDLRNVENSLIRQLIATGLIRSDRLCLGLELADNGAVISADGTISDRLFYVGPLLKAKYWEATAVPELRRHAAQLASTLLARITD
jgi:uncharacterized NAD(P)/FAD-binding protein YdhS